MNRELGTLMGGLEKGPKWGEETLYSLGRWALLRRGGQACGDLALLDVGARSLCRGKSTHNFFVTHMALMDLFSQMYVYIF